MEKGKGMMLVIIGMLGVIIAALVAGFIFLFSQMDNDPSENGNVVRHDPVAVTELDILVVPLNESVQTNLYVSPDGSRNIVRGDFGIGINNTDAEAAQDFMREMMEREIAIMDRITNILRRTTREELAHADGTDMLAERVLITLQELFDTRMIVRVYISNLVTN